MNKYFDKIYLLNLSRRPDRLAASEKKLKTIGLEYTIFNGTDGFVMKKVWDIFKNKNYALRITKQKRCKVNI